MRLVPRIFLLTLLLCSFAFAQTTGNIYGTVTDSSGAPLPKVTVTLTSPALINAQAQVTGAVGSVPVSNAAHRHLQGDLPRRRDLPPPCAQE